MQTSPPLRRRSRAFLPLWSLGALLAFVATAEAGGFGVSVTCPAKVVPGQPFELSVRIVNRECQALDVRLTSSLVGNATGGASGAPSGEVGLFGPKVAGTVSVPAAVDLYPPNCVVGAPAEAAFSVPSPVIFPAAFAGVAARQFLVADVPGTTLRDQDVCAVPEPAAVAAGAAALLALYLLRRRGDDR